MTRKVSGAKKSRSNPYTTQVCVRRVWENHETRHSGYCPGLDSNQGSPEIGSLRNCYSITACTNFHHAVTMNTKKGGDANDDVLFRHNVPSHNNKAW
jgi:hypothetical protein